MLIYYKNKRKQMYQEKEELKNQFEKQLLQSRIEIQEQTFTHISGEIHDNVGQSLSLAKVQLSILEEANQYNRETVREVKQIISQSLSELRSLAHSLNGERIRSFNLSKSVEEELERLRKTGAYTVAINQEGDPEEIPDEHRLMLFRVIQEALQNIVKHAKAGSIHVGLKKTHTICQVEVSDNGKGFTATPETSTAHGLGIVNMQKRVELMGGRLEIDSVPGKGTILKITIPYG
jgi:signal transduction histidine kinase